MSDEESTHKASTSKPTGKNAKKKVIHKGDRAKAGKPMTKEALKSELVKRNDKPRQKAAAPVRLPQNLSSSSTPAKNDPFMGETIFASDYGIVGGVATIPRMYFTNNYAGYVDLVQQHTQ